MYQYEEEFLIESFPEIRNTYTFFALMKHETCFEASERKAIRFLEANCSVVYGFPEEVDNVKPMKEPIKMIPSPYGSAVIYPLFRDLENLNPKVLKVLEENFLKCRRKNGFFGYFMDVPDLTKDLFPEDIDDTSLFLMALHMAGEVTKEHCLAIGTKMLKIFKQSEFLGKNGEISTWLPKDTSRENEDIILSRLLKGARIDLGSIINTLWFLTTFGLGDDELLSGSIDFIEKYIDVQHDFKEKRSISGLSYYTNHYVIYFLLSRYIQVSDKARLRFGRKFSEIIEQSLFILSEQISPQPLDMACVILAAFNLKLDYEIIPTGNLSFTPSMSIHKLLSALVQKLVNLQSKDGSFPAWTIFSWNKRGHFGGSKAVTTGFCVSAISTARKRNIVV